MSVELQRKKQEICELKSQQRSSAITHQGLWTTFEQEIRDLKSQISSNLIAHQLSMAKELELTYIGLLHRAAEYNNVQIYRDYITANLPYLKDTNPRDENAITPLHRAAKRGHLNMCQLILKSFKGKTNQSRNPKDDEGITPLHHAARSGYLDVFKIIFVEVVNNATLCNVPDFISLKDEKKKTPINYAAEAGHWDVCRYILNKTIMNKNPEDDKGLTPLHYAAESGILDICQHIISCIPVKNPVDFRGITPLHNASKSGFYGICKLILENAGEKNPSDQYGFTPLHCAAFFGHTAIYQLFMDISGIDKIPKDHLGATPLHYAAKNGHLNVCKQILGNVNAIHLKDKQGFEPIHYAKQYGQMAVVNLLEPIWCEAEEAEKLRRIQMRENIDRMRQNKTEYLQYQQQLAVQRIQEQVQNHHQFHDFTPIFSNHNQDLIRPKSDNLLEYDQSEFHDMAPIDTINNEHEVFDLDEIDDSESCPDTLKQKKPIVSIAEDKKDITTASVVPAALVNFSDGSKYTFTNHELPAPSWKLLEPIAAATVDDGVNQFESISDDQLNNKTAVEETESTANETVSEAVEKSPDSASASLIKLKYDYSEGMFIVRICSL